MVAVLQVSDTVVMRQPIRHALFFWVAWWLYADVGLPLASQSPKQKAMPDSARHC